MDKQPWRRRWLLVAVCVAVLVGGAFIVGGFRPLPDGAVVLTEDNTTWERARTYVFVRGDEWCDGSESVSAPIPLVGTRSTQCAEPGEEGALSANPTDAEYPLLLVDRSVESVEQQRSDGPVLTHVVTQRTSRFGVVVIPPSSSPNKTFTLVGRDGRKVLVCHDPEF